MCQLGKRPVSSSVKWLLGISYTWTVFCFGDASGYFPADLSDSDAGLEGSKTVGDAETVLIN